MGEHLLNFWRWLLNTVQQAAIAEAPAVMTAAGHKINRTTKKVEYNHASDKDVKQLRSNLTAIGEAGVNAPGAAKALELGYNIVRHPKQTYKATKHAVSYLRKNLRPIKPAYKITAENAASITPEQWTAAQDAAIARGDMAEAQRLRDLHFKIKSGNDNTVFAHTTNAKFTEFDKSHFGETDEGFNGKGFYFSTTRIPEDPSIYSIAKGPKGEIPTMNYGKNKMYTYLKGDREFNVGNPERDFFEEPNTVGIVGKALDGRPREVIIGNPNHIKSADAVTYDNNGVRIPLGLRDNFNMNDIRYAIFPFVGGGVGYGLYNTYDR